jgi:hypothetical protein
MTVYDFLAKVGLAGPLTRLCDWLADVIRRHTPPRP